MRAAIIGAVESTAQAIEAVARAPGWEVALVMSLPPELGHRHSDFVDIAAHTRAAGAELCLTNNGNGEEAIERLRASKPDFVFVIGWSQICRADFLATAPGRVIGYHPAALPRLRGRAAMPWTILQQEPITAGTLFWIDDDVDSGAILDQQFFHVAPDETAASLYAKHMAALSKMLDRTLPALARGEQLAEAQDDRLATWAARRTPADGRIDWTSSADAIGRLVRAVGRPYPGAFTMLGDDKITLWTAAVADGVRHLASPGQIIAIDDDALTVKCGDGSALRITDWSSASGKKPCIHHVLGRAA